MEISLNSIPQTINGEVKLPASKSISNRVLILNALSDSDMPVENLSDCDDTNHMLEVLNSDDCHFNIGHAGTAMRFLTAFLSRIVGRWEITGSERMQQRPVGVLVDALNRLGAHIEYAGQNGYPPLRIYGSYLKGGAIEIPASVSSQYISAILMIAPYMADGLQLTLTGKIVSRTYIDMTIALQREFGAEISVKGHCIHVKPGNYRPVHYRVESDWSGASYFYELLAMTESGQIILPGLLPESLQGDSHQTEVWKQLGVHTRFTSQGVVIERKNSDPTSLKYDFTEMPDLVQSFAVACCIRNIPFEFSGVETLRIKETDRISALITELKKLGYILTTGDGSQLIWNGERRQAQTHPRIMTYNDHRMAMAFAPAALKHPGLTIVDQEVVSKSFPTYWEQLSALGLEFT